MNKFGRNVVVALMVLLSFSVWAQQAVVAKSKSDVSMKLELEAAIGKGLSWLAGQQKADGTWGEPEYPALSALALTAFQGDPSGTYKIGRAHV